MQALRYRDWTGAPHVVVALLLVAAAVALLLISTRVGDEKLPAFEPAAARDAGQRPEIAIRREAPGQSFAAAGASFAVSTRPEAGWADAVRREDPGAGRRWIVVSVVVENLSRQRFNPALLPYLLRAGDGRLFAPDRAGIAGPGGLGRASGLPLGARAEERLAFAVPATLRRPTLTIQPSPARALEVRLPLLRR